MKIRALAVSLAVATALMAFLQASPAAAVFTEEGCFICVEFVYEDGTSEIVCAGMCDEFFTGNGQTRCTETSDGGCNAWGFTCSSILVCHPAAPTGHDGQESFATWTYSA